MNDIPYSNRELDQKFDQLTDAMAEMKEDIMQVLERIEAQTTKTNGRVSKLEGWRAWITGGLAVSGIIILPLATYVLYEVANLHDTVQAAVQTALIPYSK